MKYNPEFKENLDLNLYLAIGSTFADGISLPMLSLAIKTGKLEQILLWGGLIAINTVSAIGNFSIYKKNREL